MELSSYNIDYNYRLVSYKQFTLISVVSTYPS